MMREPPIKEITRKIVEAFQPRRIVMFGSRARGAGGADRDLDLFVEMDSDDPPLKRGMAVDALFSRRDWAMDVIVWTPEEVREQRQYRNSLIQVIEREGRVLYEQPG